MQPGYTAFVDDGIQSPVAESIARLEAPVPI